MKKYTRITRLLGLSALVAAATVLAAVPAFAAQVNQVSIVGLDASLSGGSEVPPPRMFTEGSDLAGPARPVFVVVNGEEIPVYLDINRDRVYLVNGSFYRNPQGTGDAVPIEQMMRRYHTDADGNTVFEPPVQAQFFPSDGDQYVFPGGELPDNMPQLRGRGPHGGYTTTSAKCAVCHSAHSSPAVSDGAQEGAGAGSTGDPISAANVRGQRFLTRGGATNCEFCHLTGTPVGAAGMSTNVVYHGGDFAESNIGWNGDVLIDDADFSGHRLLVPNQTIPNSVQVGGTSPVVLTDGLTCSTCHAVHGNIGTWQPPDFFVGDGSDPIDDETFTSAGQFNNDETTSEFGYKLLRANPAADFNQGVPAASVVRPDASDGPYAGVPAKDPNTVNQFMMNTWCATCHNADNLNVKMTSIRPSGGIELQEDGAVPVWESLVTTFTAESADVHNADGGFAAGYGDAADPEAQPHPTAFIGNYSGPGQCYTCHRGDLGVTADSPIRFGPAGDPNASFDADGVIIPVDEAVSPDIAWNDPNLTLDPSERSLAPFRALGYFSLSNDTDKHGSLVDQQARNLACSNCHFGTADYARWARASDWPHRSGNSDTMLLGLDLNSDQTDALNNGRLTADVAAQVFCSRCHAAVTLDDTSNGFVISQHYINHAGLVNSGNNNLGDNQSPGFAPTTPPPSNDVTDTPTSTP
ncbi:MAG: hypothetical protein FWE46_00115 [Coriobacteriia bacterium]|nr:hypothetical protein [Coriobacteriia bacterium]MCL2536814.1 hypothetical protein [Coriobacteriia bacterium]